MTAQKGQSSHQSFDSTSGTGNTVKQNKRIKEAQISEDSREPTEEEMKAIDEENQVKGARG